MVIRGTSLPDCLYACITHGMHLLID